MALGGALCFYFDSGKQEKGVERGDGMQQRPADGESNWWLLQRSDRFSVASVTMRLCCQFVLKFILHPWAAPVKDLKRSQTRTQVAAEHTTFLFYFAGHPAAGLIAY